MKKFVIFSRESIIKVPYTLFAITLTLEIFHSGKQTHKKKTMW